MESKFTKQNAREAAERIASFKTRLELASWIQRNLRAFEMVQELAGLHLRRIEAHATGGRAKTPRKVAAAKINAKKRNEVLDETK